MKTYEKSHKLDHVCYDIRGPIMDEANRMIRAGEDVMKLNIGNPAHFGFKTPEPLLKAMAENLPNTEGYTDSHGLMSAAARSSTTARKRASRMSAWMMSSPETA